MLCLLLHPSPTEGSGPPHSWNCWEIPGQGHRDPWSPSLLSGQRPWAELLCHLVASRGLSSPSCRRPARRDAPSSTALFSSSAGQPRVTPHPRTPRIRGLQRASCVTPAARLRLGGRGQSRCPAASARHRIALLLCSEAGHHPIPLNSSWPPKCSYLSAKGTV